jgi:hypothetical protein
MSLLAELAGFVADGFSQPEIAKIPVFGYKL